MNRPVFYIVAALCFMAMLPGMPYDFFMLLRVCVCGVAIYGAAKMLNGTREWLAWGCIVLAILFNPILKVHLGRDTWWLMDGVASVFLCFVALKGMPRPR